MASWIILLPLLSALINGLFCKKIGKTFAGLISCALMLTATVIAIITFYAVAIHHQEQYLKFFTWLKIANLHVSWGMYLDVVSASMLLMISLISTLIHIYSLGYMSEDENLPRFMSYLSLFTFFMMVLISADNFLQLFVGWEGVGLCSYLLIGFWYHKEAANKAAMKAFIVNRVGDVGYVLGIISIYYVFNSLEFAEVFAAVSTKQYLNVNFLGIELSAINLICMLLFIGAMGKSAQICLHTWLPDAMEGPTPVSALIHAATMVTAGVFLIVRCSPLFAYALEVNNIIMLVGSLTCLFAAFVALSQTDIKKIIAYSTCSQLGYMFFACGAGAYDAGLFHLLTHAFFKALLFLGAGSVIHSLGGVQDINKMGGLMHKLPFTYIMMWLGSLSLAGIYPFSGYYSKDLILEAVYANGSNVARFAFYIGLIGALATAFYSWRLIIKCFHGRAHPTKEVMNHLHDAPYSMAIPQVILAVGAILLGWYGYSILHVVGGDFWQQGIFFKTKLDLEGVPTLVKKAPLILGIIGIIAAYFCYQFNPIFLKNLVKKIRFLYTLSLNKCYFDEIYECLIVKPLNKLAVFFWKIIDTILIDAVATDGMAYLSRKLGNVVNKTQTGYIYHYLLVMLLAIIIIISYFIIKL